MFTIHHCKIESLAPHWYQLEFARDFDRACRRARQYALDNGGYVCVKDRSGEVVFGTNPIDLQRNIEQGQNRYWRQIPA